MTRKGKFRYFAGRFTAFLLTLLLAAPAVSTMLPGPTAVLAEEKSIQTEEQAREEVSESAQLLETAAEPSETEAPLPADESRSGEQEESELTAVSDPSDEDEAEEMAEAALSPPLSMASESGQSRDSEEAFSVTVTIHWHDFGKPTQTRYGMAQQVTLFRQHPDRPEDIKQIDFPKIHQRRDEEVTRLTWEAADHPDLLKKPKDSEEDYIYFARQGNLNNGMPGPFGYIADESGRLELHNYNPTTAVGGLTFDVEYIKESTGETIPIDKKNYLYKIHKLSETGFFNFTRDFSEGGRDLLSSFLFNSGVLDENKTAKEEFSISQHLPEQAHVLQDNTNYNYELTYTLAEDADSPSGQKLVLKQKLITYRENQPAVTTEFEGFYPETLLFSNTVKEDAKGTILIHKVMKAKRAGGIIIVGSTGSSASEPDAYVPDDRVLRNGPSQGEYAWPLINGKEAGIRGCPGNKSYRFELWKDGDSQAMETFTLPNEDGSWTKVFSDLELGSYKLVEVMEPRQEPPNFFVNLFNNSGFPIPPTSIPGQTVFELTTLHSVADITVENLYYAPNITVKKAWHDLQPEDESWIAGTAFQLYRYPLGREEETEKVGVPKMLYGVDAEGNYYAQWDGKYLGEDPVSGYLYDYDLECFKLLRENDKVYNIPYVYFVEEIPVKTIDPETGEMTGTWPFVAYKGEGGFGFVNYRKKSFDLEAQKVFALDAEGNVKLPLEENAFSFELYKDGSEEPLAEVLNDAAGKIVFEDVPGPEKVGPDAAVTYRIKEKQGTLSDVSYSEAVYEAKLYYTVDQASKELVTHVEYFLDGKPAEEAVFVNVLNLEARLSLKAKKTLEGRALGDQEFSFELWQGEEKISDAKNMADGSIAFPELIYTGADIGEHHYLIKEVNDGQDGVTYDERVFGVTVTVSQDMDPTGKRILKAVTDPETPPVFVNQYEEPTVLTDPPEPTVPSEPPEPTVPSEPPEPTVPSETPEPTVPSETPEPTVPSETPEPTVPSEKPEPTVPSEMPEPTVPSVTPEPTVPSEKPEPTVPSEKPEPTVPSEKPEPTVPSELTEATEPTLPTETEKPTETAAPAKSTLPTETEEPTETAAPAEPTEPTETAAPTGSAKQPESQTSETEAVPTTGERLPMLPILSIILAAAAAAVRAILKRKNEA